MAAWPWEQVGIHFDPPITANDLEEVLQDCDLDFNINLSPTYYEYKGKMTAIPNKFTVLRSDTGTVFGIVGYRYTPIQVKDFLTAIANTGKLQGLWYDFHKGDAIQYGISTATRLNASEFKNNQFRYLPYIFTTLSFEGKQSASTSLVYIDHLTKSVLPVIKSKHFGVRFLHNRKDNRSLLDNKDVKDALHNELRYANRTLHKLAFTNVNDDTFINLLKVSGIKSDKAIESILDYTGNDNALDKVRLVSYYWDHEYSYHTEISKWRSTVKGKAFKSKRIFLDSILKKVA